MSLSLSLSLFHTIAVTNCSYRNNLLATLSQLSRKLASRVSILILAHTSLLNGTNFPWPGEESEESSMRKKMKNQHEYTSRSFSNIDLNPERENSFGGEEFESLTRLTDVHVHVVADTVGESRIQQLVHAEFAALPSKRVLSVGIDSPAIGASPRQTHNRDQRQQSHLDIVEISVPNDECAFHPPLCNHPRP